MKTKAKSNFEKYLYQLMDAFIAKSLENARDLEFIFHSQMKRIIKRQSKTNFNASQTGFLR